MVGLPPERRLLYQFSVSRGEFKKIGEEISELKRALLYIGFPSKASRRALIAVYELGMNVVIHAYKGTVKTFWKDGSLEIVAEDQGPGISDIETAMKEGYSTAPPHVREMGYGAGMGLPNAKRASDVIKIESIPGRGTSVVCQVLPGPQDMQVTGYFHSVKLESSKCRGCTNCIKGCPTEAIRVRNGKAFILEDRCIDCGECIRRCPNRAKVAISDPWEILETFDYKIALVAPSFYGQFGNVNPGRVKAALCVEGGFDEVFDVSIAADLCSYAMREYVKDRAFPRPLISPACPAVLRLIQVRYPSLLKHVIPCEAPMEVAAWLAKMKARSENPDRKAAAVFISPCPAKITAARQPVGRGRSMIDAIVSMKSAYSWVREHLSEVKEEREFPTSTGFGIGWGRSGGEMAAVGLTGLAVDGILQVASVLDEIEKGNLKDVDFVEAQACIGGCVGGCLTVENPFVARMRLRDLAAQHKEAPLNKLISGITKDEPRIWLSLDLVPRPIFKLDEDPEKARDKLARLEEIEEQLPGLDCGACGAPTCRALAEDIVLGRGSIWDCTFKLRERLESLAQEVKDLAGKRPPAMAVPQNNGVEKGPVQCAGTRLDSET